MMESKELRLGNYLRANHKSFTKKYNGQIVSIDADILIEILRGDIYYEPIELSPEILERCGFVADHVSHYGGWLIKVNNDEQIRIVWNENIGWHWPMNGHNKPIVNYLHQLQNIYYCLCGEELTFKQ